MKGSSPRVWGQGAVAHTGTVSDGIIPTRMGTSVDKHSVILIQQDHPHAYGDKFAFVNTMPKIVGSSPRVWGQEVCSKIEHRGIRIIPTRMGTSCNTFRWRTWSKDHPHAYGDKICRRNCTTTFTGSSPRVWGQAKGRENGNLSIRIIPTRMGTSR